MWNLNICRYTTAISDQTCLFTWHLALICRILNNCLGTSFYRKQGVHQSTRLAQIFSVHATDASYVMTRFSHNDSSRLLESESIINCNDSSQVTKICPIPNYRHFGWSEAGIFFVAVKKDTYWTSRYYCSTTTICWLVFHHAHLLLVFGYCKVLCNFWISLHHWKVCNCDLPGENPPLENCCFYTESLFLIYRYLVTGDYYRTPRFSYWIIKSTVSKIIPSGMSYNLCWCHLYDQVNGKR